MTVAISASLVKELRDQTGAGMMDAKQALVDAGGDIEAARILLRERGMASAAKRGGTKIMLVLAPVSSTAAWTVLKIGIPSTSWPALPGVTPATTSVP